MAPLTECGATGKTAATTFGATGGYRRQLQVAHARHVKISELSGGYGFGGLRGADVLEPYRPPATRGAHSRKVTEGGTPGRYPPRGGCKNPPVVSVRTMPDAKATTDAAETGGGWGSPYKENLCPRSAPSSAAESRHYEYV